MSTQRPENFDLSLESLRLISQASSTPQVAKLVIYKDALSRLNETLRLLLADPEDRE